MLDIEALRSNIAEIAKKHDLSVVALFGSQATGRTHSKSDIDIAVLSRSPIEKFKIMSDLEDIFKRDDIEVVNLASASPTLMYCVVRDGRLLYEKNSGDFLGWKFYAIKVWMETAWLRRLRDKKLVEWAKRVNISTNI